jgi:hypothetical protein
MASQAYAVGDFSFIKNDLLRASLEEDYAIINKTDLWGALYNHDSNKPFYLDPHWNISLSKNHSGASHALSLRTFEAIAKDGWVSYVTSYLSKND